MARRRGMTVERRAPRWSSMLRRGIPQNPVAHATDEPSAHDANPTVSLRDATPSTNQRPGELSSAAATTCLFSYADGDFSHPGGGGKKRRQGKSHGGSGPLLKPRRGGVMHQQPGRIARSVRGDIPGKKNIVAAVYAMEGPQASESPRGVCEGDGRVNYDFLVGPRCRRTANKGKRTRDCFMGPTCRHHPTSWVERSGINGSRQRK
jgi:hypothetical protein